MVELLSELTTLTATAAPTAVPPSLVTALPSAVPTASVWADVRTVTPPWAVTVTGSRSVPAIVAVTSVSAMLMPIAAATLTEPSDVEASGAVVVFEPLPVRDAAWPFAKSVCAWLCWFT